MSIPISTRQKAALERLIRIAQADTGQSRMTAEFLLSWWNAANCGGFDLTTLWGVDTEIAADMVTVFSLVAASCRSNVTTCRTTSAARQQASRTRPAATR
jgi:hypothetical protein